MPFKSYLACMLSLYIHEEVYDTLVLEKTEGGSDKTLACLLSPAMR